MPQYVSANVLGARDDPPDGITLCFWGPRGGSQAIVTMTAEQVRDMISGLQQAVDRHVQCELGLHSWVGETGRLPATTRCTTCGEIYGDPE